MPLWMAACAFLLRMGMASSCAHACNLASFTITSIVPATPDTILNFTMCLGVGRTGMVMGGDVTRKVVKQ